MKRSSAFFAIMAAGFATSEVHAQIRPVPSRAARQEQQVVIAVDQYRFRFFNQLNGFVVQDEAAPSVRFTAFVRVGTADNRSPGAAEVLAEIIGHEGPCWIAPRTLQAVVSDLGGELDVRMGVTLTEITLTAPAGREREAIRVFSGLIREPCIRSSTVSRVREHAVTPDLTAQDVTDLSTLFERRLYQDHPYGVRITEDDVEELEVKDVTRFHEDFFMPSNVILAVSGNFQRDVLIDVMDQRFSDWRRVRRPPRFGRPPKVDEQDSTTVYRYRTDSSPSSILVGQALRDVIDEDWPALQVLNHVLTGPDGTSRIGSVELGELRRGFRGTATYSFRSRNSSDALERIVDDLTRELERVRSEPVRETELEAAKGSLVRVEFPWRFADGHATARTLAMEFVRDTTLVALEGYEESVEAVSVRDIQRVAERYLRPNGLVVVMVAGVGK